jgi:hypothetical protein
MRRIVCWIGRNWDLRMLSRLFRLLVALWEAEEKGSQMAA